jgi:ribonuclease P protein component
MFSRKNRIPREKLEEIIKQSKSLGGDFFNIKFSENNLDFPRFSVVVAKKTCKSSVGRHLLKRRAVSMIKSQIKTFSNRDYVFFVKKEAINKDFKEIKTNLESFLKKNSL